MKLIQCIGSLMLLSVCTFVLFNVNQQTQGKSLSVIRNFFFSAEFKVHIREGEQEPSLNRKTN